MILRREETSNRYVSINNHPEETVNNRIMREKSIYVKFHLFSPNQAWHLSG